MNSSGTSRSTGHAEGKADKISSERIARDIAAIAACNATDPAVGCSRPTFSPAWGAARDYVIEEAKRAGATPRIDAAGNLHLRRPASVGPVWLCGSHLDSVPTGGQFDGVVGVVSALEVLRTNPKVPLEVVVFAEEEGTTFQLGMLGSHAWVGDLHARELQEVANAEGDDYFTAGRPYGVDPARIEADRLVPAEYRGFIELHIEQGPTLWDTGQSVAVVTAINGRRQYTVILTGSANHAGATRMADRHDALVAAAEIVTGLESLAKDLDRQSEHTVITVGRMDVFPNALNVIPGRVEFTIDFRARSDSMLSEGEARIVEWMEQIVRRRGVGLVHQRTEQLPALPLDDGTCNQLRTAARRLGVEIPDTTSGALHDAAILAPHLPTAMLFIASRGGISHDPAEYSRLEDIVLATKILAEVVNS